MFNILRCQQCHKPISQGVYKFSREQYGYALCLDHQRWMEDCGADSLIRELYFTLKSKNIPVQLEYFAGKQLVDIAIPGKLYISVDPKEVDSQPLQDLAHWRAQGQGPSQEVPTVRIPDSLARNSEQWHQAIDTITEYCLELKEVG